MTLRTRITKVAVLATAALPLLAFGQPPGGPPRGPPPPPLAPREAAPVDLTGTWVSVVSEDWRWRMLTPMKNDFQSIPLNREGVRVGQEWDPAKDEALGLQCKSFGAAAIMRVPGRVRISWQDEKTLKVETDAGMQTRVLNFGAPPTTSEGASWQGYSVAN